MYLNKNYMDNCIQDCRSRNFLLTSQTDDTIVVHVTVVHVYVNERKYHHGNPRWIFHCHHHPPLKMSQVFRPLADRRLPVLTETETEAGWQWLHQQISRT